MYVYFQMYVEEFPQQSAVFSQAVLKLDNIIENLLFQVSSATSSTDLVPGYILASIANVLEALQFNRTNHRLDPISFPFDEMKALSEKVVNLIDMYLVEVYLETQITGERPIFIDAGYFTTKAQRLLARNIMTHVTLDGTEAKAILPEELLNNVSDEDTEIFQTVTCMKTNPYNWGFEESNVEVSSQILAISFRYAENKSEVEIADLPEDKMVQLWIPKPRNTEEDEDENVSQNDSIAVLLGRNQTIVSPLNITHTLLRDTAVHVEIKATAMESGDFSVIAYLGYGYKPVQDRFDDVLFITAESQDSHDHMNYTFFIYNG